LGKSKNHPSIQAVKGYTEGQTIEDLRWTETLPVLKSVREGKTIPAEKVFS